jgi:hypothetical protein
MALVILGLAIVLVASVSAYLRAASIHTGRDDLVLDDDRRELTLPATYGRDIPLAIPFDSVRSVRIGVDELGGRSDPDRMREGHAGIGRGDTLFQVMLDRWQDGETWHEVVVICSDIDRARGFVQWLCRQLGLDVDESAWRGVAPAN